MRRPTHLTGRVRRVVGHPGLTGRRDMTVVRCIESLCSAGIRTAVVCELDQGAGVARVALSGRVRRSHALLAGFKRHKVEIYSSGLPLIGGTDPLDERS